MDFKKDSLFLKVKDHSVSKESFDLYRNLELDMLITSPLPDFMERYYDSEDYISHTDHNRTLFEKCYHLVKKKALGDKVKLINKLTSQRGYLLDIGAGTGEFLSVALHDGWSITGSEPSEKARKFAMQKKIILQENTSGLDSHSFDIITMWHVLEHVSDLEGQIREIKRLLKPSGVLIIAVPNYHSFDAQYYGQFWAAYDVPRHLWHFSKTSIKRLFEGANMRLEEILPMKFDSFYVSLLSEKYKNGRMNPLKAFYIGLKSNIVGRKSNNYSSHIYILKSYK